MVQGFEQDFARFCESPAMLCGRGHERMPAFCSHSSRHTARRHRLTVPNTFIAKLPRLFPKRADGGFIDIDERTYTMDPARLHQLPRGASAYGTREEHAALKTGHQSHSRRSGIFISGQMAEMDAILDLAINTNFKVIEDACQAQGAVVFSQRKIVGARPAP